MGLTSLFEGKADRYPLVQRHNTSIAMGRSDIRLGPTNFGQSAVSFLAIQATRSSLQVRPGVSRAITSAFA
jgi:hypothetical protein